MGSLPFYLPLINAKKCILFLNSSNKITFQLSCANVNEFILLVGAEEKAHFFFRVAI
jgi:hypothetical protein